MSGPQKRERDPEPASEPKRHRPAADRASLALSRPGLDDPRRESALQRARNFAADLSAAAAAEARGLLDPLETLALQLRHRDNRFQDVARVCALALHYRAFLRRYGRLAHPEIVHPDFVAEQLGDLPKDRKESVACAWTAALEFFADSDRPIHIDPAL
jgi:hypothetical protein